MKKIKFKSFKAKKIYNIICFFLIPIILITLIVFSSRKTVAIDSDSLIAATNTEENAGKEVDITDGELEDITDASEEEFIVEKDGADYVIDLEAKDSDGDDIDISAVRVQITNTATNEKVTGWCKDPYASAAWSSGSTNTYSKKDNVSQEAIAAYQDIMDQTCDDEEMMATAIRSSAVSMGDVNIPADISDGNFQKKTQKYGGLADGTNFYGSSAEENAEFRKVMDSAQNAAVNANKTGSNKGTQISSSEYVYESNEQLNIKDSRCTESKNGDKFVYNCNIADTCSAGDTDPVKMSDMLDGSDPGEGGTPGEDGSGDSGSKCAPCKVEIYTVNNGTEAQEFVVCVDQNGNSRGEGGKMYDSSGNQLTDDQVQDLKDDGVGDLGFGDLALECEPEEIEDPVDCDPWIEDIEDMGSEICYPDGTTVVEIIEQNKKDKDDILGCILEDSGAGKDKDVTKANENNTTDIFFPSEENKAYYGNEDNTNIAKSNGADDLDLCSVHCTEDYYMNLPGPTADKLTGEVMVNSGTFFTVDDNSGEIFNETKVQCYLSQNYGRLIQAVDIQRKRSAVAYTATKMKESVDADYYSSPHTCGCATPCAHPTYDEEGNFTGYEHACDSYYWCYDWKKPNYDVKNISVNRMGLSEVSAGFTSSSDYPGVDGSLDSVKCEGTGYSGPSSCENKNTKKTEYENTYKQMFTDAGGNLDEVNTDAKSKIKNSYEVWKNTCTDKLDFTKINKAIYERDECQTKLSFWYEELKYFTEDKKIYPEVLLDGKATQTGYKLFDDEPYTGDKDTPDKKLCTSSGCSGTDKEKVDRYLYRIYEEKSTAKYKLVYNFCNPYNDSKKPFFCGDENNCKSLCTGENAGSIIKGFPVSLETPQGKYSYRYDYNGMGHYFENGGSQCFMGTKEAPVGRLEDVIALYGYTEYDYDNTCVYSVNNCTACSVRCVDKGEGSTPGPSCNLDFFGCNKICKVACVSGGCILDFNTGFLVSYRTISLNNPFPVAYEFLETVPTGTLALVGGSPIVSDSKVSSTKAFHKSNWETNKGKQIKNQWSSGDLSEEKVYGQDASYTFILDPGTIKEIQDYNKTEGYPNKSSLSCSKSSAADYSICRSPFVQQYDPTGYKNASWEDWKSNLSDAFTGPAYR